MSVYINEDYNPSARETVNTSYYRNKEGLNTLPDDILDKIINVSNYEDNRNINYLDRDFNSRYPKSYLQSKSAVIEPHGTIRTYYDSYKTKLKEIIEYRNGVKHGQYLSYYESDLGDTRINIEIEANYNNNKLEGKRIHYFENGNIHTFHNYKNGRKNGKYQIYRENGEIRTNGNYKDNKLDGIITTYFENGSIYQILSYAYDKLNGESIEYYENGEIKKVSNYKDDMLNGMQIFNDRLPEIVSVTNYRS